MFGTHTKEIIVDEETRTMECNQSETKTNALTIYTKCVSKKKRFKKFKIIKIEINKLQKKYTNLTKEIEPLKKI